MDTQTLFIGWLIEQKMVAEKELEKAKLLWRTEADPEAKLSANVIYWRHRLSTMVDLIAQWSQKRKG